VVEPAQVWNQLKSGGYGLGGSERVPRSGERDSETVSRWRWGGQGEFLRCTFGEAAAAKLGVHPVDRCEVNVGTVPVLPFPIGCLPVGGQVHRRLLMPERDGGFVVVRARESRVHGEGTQQVRSEAAGMSGGRR
jgi:hypothetical protein